MMDYHCTKFDDFGFSLSRFGLIVYKETDRQTDRQTCRQTESQRRMIAILTRLYTVGVSKVCWLLERG